MDSEAGHILSCRSAFSLFLKSGIEAVAKEFPSCVAFVNENKDLSMEEVTAMLTLRLDELTQIRDIYKLHDFTPIQIESLRLEAAKYKEIQFKIKAYENDTVTIGALQEKEASIYYSVKDMVSISHSLFDKHCTGKRVFIHAIPYVDNPVLQITAAWVREKMLEKGIKLKEIAAHTGISTTNLRKCIESDEPLPPVYRAMFYYYFSYS